MAMVMDRISRGFAEKYKIMDTDYEYFKRRKQILIISASSIFAVIILAQVFQSLREFPAAWIINPAGSLNDGVDYVVASYSGVRYY